MSEHYFSNKPQSKSEPKTWKFQLKGFSLSFTSDHGVFSKSEVDFGSRTLIEVFQEPEVEGDFLDLGCGYGPIGITLAKSFPHRRVVLSDINERAVSLARQNALQNNANNIDFYVSNRFESFPTRKFSAILINPPIRAGKNLVLQMFEESYQALINHGELWVVIQKKQGAPSAKKKLEEMFSEVALVEKNKGYYVFCSKK